MKSTGWVDFIFRNSGTKRNGHGKCCDCVAHHRDNNEGVPGRFFSKEAEATYDRSIEALCRDRGILK